MSAQAVCAKHESASEVAPSGVIRAPLITQDMQVRVIEALSCLRAKIGVLPHVRKIAYSPKCQLITVWTFVDNHDHKTLRSIYKEEQYLMETFWDLRFDFTVIFDHDSDAPDNFITDLIK